MPYQKIGTPVFWVDTLQFYRAMGMGSPLNTRHDIFNMNPTSYSETSQ